MQQFHPHPYQQAGIEAILEKPGVPSGWRWDSARPS